MTLTGTGDVFVRHYLIQRVRAIFLYPTVCELCRAFIRSTGSWKGNDGMTDQGRPSRSFAAFTSASLIVVFPLPSPLLALRFPLALAISAAIAFEDAAGESSTSMGVSVISAGGYEIVH